MVASLAELAEGLGEAVSAVTACSVPAGTLPAEWPLFQKTQCECMPQAVCCNSGSDDFLFFFAPVG